MSQINYKNEIANMMYTFGECKNPNQSVLSLMEATIREQMLEICAQASALASKRKGQIGKMGTADDIIFLMRKDTTKIDRLLEFLSWKEIRKNVKKTEENPAIAAEETDTLINTLDNEIDEDEGTKKALHTIPRKKRIRLSWDILGGLLPAGIELIKDEENDNDETSDDEGLVDSGGDDSTLENESPKKGIHRGKTSKKRKDWEDEAALELHKKLEEADRITREMTKEEYIEYSDARQSSFTFKKGKKFKEWLNLSTSLPFIKSTATISDDTIEILGYLAWDLVGRLTETALIVKREYDFALDKSTKSEKNPQAQANIIKIARKQSEPLKVHHVFEAIRRLQNQTISKKAIFGIHQFVNKGILL